MLLLNGRAGRIWTCDNPVSVVRLSGWAMPTMGGLLQRLRQLSIASRLGSSARLSYRPTKTIRIRLKDLCVLAYLYRF
jgi:hypothetical protein